MSVVEGGAELAWRLLATLEGGSLLLATSALLAYSVRKRLGRVRRQPRPVKTVMLSDTTNLLGKLLKSQLESRGCVVHTAPSDETAAARCERVDALIIVGAHASAKPTNLQAIANLVNDDVYHNLEALETLSTLVKHGGCIAWACAGATEGHFQSTGEAFDTVLEASLRRVAQARHCCPVWVGRGRSAEQAAERVLGALLSCDSRASPSSSLRKAASTVREYASRWLKNVT